MKCFFVSDLHGKIDRYEKLIDKIKKELDIDFDKSKIYNDTVDIVFCIDWRKKLDGEIIFIRGNYEKLKVFDNDRPTIREFFQHLEVDNPISEVYGKNYYFEGIVKDLDSLNNINEFYLPYRVDEKLKWMCLSIISLLFFGSKR